MADWATRNGEFTSSPTNTWATRSGVIVSSAESDTTAPVLSSPTGSATGSTTATIGATTDEGNGTFYGVVTVSGTAPTAVQVENGQDNGGSAATWAGNVAVSSTGAKTLNATGLAPSTSYYGHLMHKDAAGNRSNVVSSSQFTTSASGSADPAAFSNNVIAFGIGRFGIRR